MTVTFRPAADVEGVRYALVALAGPSGGGKTKSALRLATGLANGNGKIAAIDSEARRMLHYKDQFKFDYAEFGPPFTPERMIEHLSIAAKHAGDNGVVIVDSMSHEYAGDGGLQDIHDELLEKLAKGNPARMEALSAPAWRDAKMRHRRMMSRLLQCKAHFIFCLRADDKIKFVKRTVKRDDGSSYEKTEIVPIGWQPSCEKGFMFEMACSFMLSDTAKHLPTPIKLPDEFAPMFPLDRPISEESGIALAKWARGSAAGVPSPAPAERQAHSAEASHGTPAAEEDAQSIYDEIVSFAAAETDPDRLAEAWSTDVNVPMLKTASAALYQKAHGIVNRRIKELRTA